MKIHNKSKIKDYRRSLGLVGIMLLSGYLNGCGSMNYNPPTTARIKADEQPNYGNPNQTTLTFVKMVKNPSPEYLSAEIGGAYKIAGSEDEIDINLKAERFSKLPIYERKINPNDEFITPIGYTEDSDTCSFVYTNKTATIMYILPNRKIVLEQMNIEDAIDGRYWRNKTPILFGHNEAYGDYLIREPLEDKKLK